MLLDLSQSKHTVSGVQAPSPVHVSSDSRILPSRGALREVTSQLTSFFVNVGTLLHTYIPTILPAHEDLF